jgi:hypothetical protein
VIGRTGVLSVEQGVELVEEVGLGGGGDGDAPGRRRGAADQAAVAGVDGLGQVGVGHVVGHDGLLLTVGLSCPL